MKAVEFIYRCEALDTDLPPRPDSPETVKQRLDTGNRDFAALLDDLHESGGVMRRVVHLDPRDLGLFANRPDAMRQRPFAVVLGCSDARVPVEMIFNEGPNDLFVVRVAGNGLGTEVLGSLNYAFANLASGLHLAVVLGHSGCGAVTAAVDVVLSPAHYLPLVMTHSVRGLIDRLLLGVHLCAMQLRAVHGASVTSREGYRSALIEMGVAVNAALSAHALASEIAGAGPHTVWGVYPLARHRIWSFRDGDGDCAGFADPPRDEDGLRALGVALARSDRIVSRLESS
jgi:carbonic anhydrase